MLDYLANTALSAIAHARPELRGWTEDKSASLEGKDRLHVLRWIVTELDTTNREIVAAALNVNALDLESTARVLRQI